MADVPPTPRPKRAARKGAAKSAPETPGTTGTTDTPKPAPPPSKATRAPAKPKLQKSLEEFLSVPAIVYSATGHDYPAHIVGSRAPAVAEAWYDLAQENPAVKRVLTRLVEGSAWGGVILTSASMLVPLLSYHDVIPGQNLIDPFESLYPEYTGDGIERGPIVPPPPASARAESSPATPHPAGGGATPDHDPHYQSPPVGNGPPGVITAAAVNQARG